MMKDFNISIFNNIFKFRILKLMSIKATKTFKTYSIDQKGENNEYSQYGSDIR